MTGTTDSCSRVDSLSSLIAAKAPRLARDLANGGSASALPSEEQSQIQEVRDACQELTAMLAEPHEYVVETAWGYFDTVALSFVLEMKLHLHIPQSPQVVSLSELAEKTSGSAILIKRVMRHCIKRFIFQEVAPESYRHNERSLCLLHHDFSSLIHYLTDDGLLAGAYLLRNLSQYGFQIPPDPRQSAFQLAFHTNKTLYEYYGTVAPERGQRFADAMAGHYNTPLDDPIESIYPFNLLESDALIVDIGGGKGQHSIRLAKKCPGMSFIVQDHPSVVESARATATEDVPSSVAGRVQWQAHDMDTPQPISGANGYLLSHVFMDNSSASCASVLRNIVKAMKPGHSRILVHDFMDPGKGDYVSGFVNGLDMHMIASLNCPIKSLEDWTDIFKNAHPDLHLSRMLRGSKQAVVFELTVREGSSG